MNPKVIVFASIAALGLLVAALYWLPSRGRQASVSADATRANGVAPASDTKGSSLLIYCAAGIRKPVEAAAQQYEREAGVRINLQFGGSQTLLANAKLANTGDLYIPADDSYLTLAQKEQLLAEAAPLATVRPVLAVKKGNPLGIRSLKDLTRSGVKIGLADPKAAAVGKIAKEALTATGEWDKLERAVTVTKPTVNEIATDVHLGTIDAAFVWDATVQQMAGDLEAVAIPELAEAKATISVGVLSTSREPTAALRFLRYLSSSDKGGPHFAKAGFVPAQGDAWDASPRLTLFGGAMLRPAVEDTIVEFERREGVRVDRVYNGCGILVGQMKIGERPDAYLACDTSFMTQVKDLFLDSSDISTNQLVILVPKGNPHGIKSLNDLGKPGIRLGVGHEKQCALGALTEETLRQSGTYEIVKKNRVVESPTGDLLVNQLLAGSLDAIVAYVSNATGHADELHAIKIDIPCAIAVQPMAVAKTSKHRQLTRRLMTALQSADSRDRFEAWGFRWGQP